MSRETALGIAVVVRSLDGKPLLRFTVDADRARLGSGAHCEVRLPPECVAREELLLAVAGDTVRFESKSQQFCTVLRGVAASAGILGPADVLQIGAITLTASVVALSNARRRFPIEALALVPAALVVVLALTLSSRAVAVARPPAAPRLFAETAVNCATEDTVEAGHLARQRRALAIAKRERGPFSARDAVEAVGHFRVAAACARLAGEDAKAVEDGASADLLQRKVEDEYLTRRTRLEHAFLEQDTGGVGRELPTLVAMTAHLHDPYVEWLAQEKRRAEIAAKRPTGALL